MTARKRFQRDFQSKIVKTLKGSQDFSDTFLEVVGYPITNLARHIAVQGFNINECGKLRNQWRLMHKKPLQEFETFKEFWALANIYCKPNTKYVEKRD